MKTRAVVPAAISFDDAAPDEAPVSTLYRDCYHPRTGPLAQAQHVFIAGNGLPARWAGRAQFAILETGFGLGNNFLATWQAWRDDVSRCRRLIYVAIERHPPTLQDLRRAHARSPQPELAAALLTAWPALLPNLHVLPFDHGAITLLLGFGDIATLLPQIRARIDAFYLDGFAPEVNPDMWQPRVIKGLGRLAAPGASVATWSVATALRASLVSAGFEVRLSGGISGKRAITLASHAPRFVVRGTPLVARLCPPSAVVVIGAGLAGAWTAYALAQRGVRVTVIDRQAMPAAGASGNAGGIYHATVHADDGPHARLLRAAALFAHRLMRPLIDSGLVPGQARGLLRLQSGADALATMRGQVTAQGLPPEYVQALDAERASLCAGLQLDHAAWYFADAGWVSPLALVQHLMASTGVRFEGSQRASRLLRDGENWQVLDASGCTIAQAPVLVVANAEGVLPLLAELGHAHWPLQGARGQLSLCETSTSLQLPVAGDGYALSLSRGTVLCGASSRASDMELEARDSDHAFNYARLQRLVGIKAPRDPSRWSGRVAFRVQTPDRHPVVGAVPLAPENQAPTQRMDQARFVPRTPGLFVHTALGGRGITLAPLMAELLAAQICGEPLPLEADLVDAVDPARWAVQRARKLNASESG